MPHDKPADMKKRMAMRRLETQAHEEATEWWKHLTDPAYQPNFGTLLVQDCPECYSDHLSNITEECYQNELLVGYWATCLASPNRVFITVEEVTQEMGEE